MIKFFSTCLSGGCHLSRLIFDNFNPRVTCLGPYRAPKVDLMIFEKISGSFRKFRAFLYFTFFSRSYHVGLLILSLSNSTKAQGTLLDLHGPTNGLLNGPSEANFWGPLVKKGPAGSLHGPNWSIFLDRSLDNVQTWIYSLVWGQSDIRFLSN